MLAKSREPWVKAVAHEPFSCYFGAAQPVRLSFQLVLPCSETTFHGSSYSTKLDVWIAIYFGPGVDDMYPSWNSNTIALKKQQNYHIFRSEWCNLRSFQWWIWRSCDTLCFNMFHSHNYCCFTIPPMMNHKVPYESRWHGKWYEDADNEFHDMKEFPCQFQFMSCKFPHFATGKRNPEPLSCSI